MPISKYFKGHGKEVMSKMMKEYGKEKGKEVFYATSNKKGIGELKGHKMPKEKKEKKKGMFSK